MQTSVIEYDDKRCKCKCLVLPLSFYVLEISNLSAFDYFFCGCFDVMYVLWLILYIWGEGYAFYEKQNVPLAFSWPKRVTDIDSKPTRHFYFYIFLQIEIRDYLITGQVFACLLTVAGSSVQPLYPFFSSFSCSWSCLWNWAISPCSYFLPCLAGLTEMSYQRSDCSRTVSNKHWQ